MARRETGRTHLAGIVLPHIVPERVEVSLDEVGDESVFRVPVRSGRDRDRLRRSVTTHARIIVAKDVVYAVRASVCTVSYTSCVRPSVPGRFISLGQRCGRPGATDDACAPFFQTVAKTSRRMMGVLMTMRAVSSGLAAAVLSEVLSSLLLPPRKGTGFHRFILAAERRGARWKGLASSGFELRTLGDACTPVHTCTCS